MVILHACYFKDLGAFSTDQRRASATAGKLEPGRLVSAIGLLIPQCRPGRTTNSTPARELEPPQPLLRSLDGGQHPCAKIGASVRRRWPARRPPRPAPPARRRRPWGARS